MYRLAQSHRCGHRRLLALATSVLAGLATAGPALATEVPAPPPMPEVTAGVPDPTVPPLPIPVPEVDIEPIVDTQIDGGNIDVSVRVLSPGEDGAVAQESETGVVSSDPEPDITVPAAPTDGASVDSGAPAVGANTNVSVRVLSPGDRGGATQITGESGEEVAEAGPVSALPQPDPAPASAAPPAGAADSTQYQPNNSRYQSDQSGANTPWHWVWVLSLDCSGSTSSSSTETGHQESLVWSWEWAWEWACSGTEGTDSTAESDPRGPPPEAAGQAADGHESTPQPSLTEPWIWTWTFTSCGETRTITTRGGTGTPLTWAWDWTWNWTCPHAAGPAAQPPPGMDAAAPAALATSAPAPTSDEDDPTAEAQRTLQLADGIPTVTLPTAWLPTVPSSLAPGASFDVFVPSVPALDVVIQLEAIPPVVLAAPAAPTAPSLPSSAIPFPALDDAAEPTTPSPAPRPDARRATSTPVPHAPAAIAAEPAHAQPRAHHARPVKQTRAHDAPSKRPREELPLDRRQPRQALGSSSAGGIVPSALLFGFAALTGFIVLAAPGLGRRIRVSRKLRPPSPDLSPIEHPG
jgi:hypothetical protein